MITITNHPELIKNPHTGAIISQDKSIYEEYMEKIKINEINNNRIDNIEKSIIEIKNNMNKLTSLIEKLLNENNI